MNDKKICFIYCVKDQRLFEESVKFLHALEIPEGYEIEVLPVLDAPSMAAGYNYAMKTSDAKYKVYLHEDVSIINKKFVEDILGVFRNDPEVGMLGLMGAKELSHNGIWWESKELFGEVYDSHTGKMQLLSFQEVEEAYQRVEVIDGLLMATQYDIPWKDEIFDGWDFYDMSQSIEFLRNGLKVVIPRQETPWVLHDCGSVETEHYFYYKSLFIHHYEWKKADNKNLPLVSILIPTYNRPQLFELALRSALGQTYPNIEVIIGDDSTNDETERLIEKYVSQFKNIHYVKNEQNLGQFQNDLMLFDLANGEYVNYLMDDDLFHHEKIEKMMKYYIEDTDKGITIVTSHRIMIDDYGNRYPEESISKRLFEEDTVIDGIKFGEFVLQYNANFIGEPTSVLFRKSDLTVPFGTFCEREYGCNVDMATWLNLLAKGKAVYISETLSYFRIHSGQQQQSNKMLVAGSADYMHEILYAPQYGFFKDASEYLSALKGAKKYADSILEKVDHSKEIQYMNEVNRLYSILIQTLSSYEQFEQTTESDLPLVSILIPAYNRPYYLELALQSALNQTYKNVEIVICDDSTNDEVKGMVERYLRFHSNIRYYKNEVNLNQKNWQKCLEYAKGDYINYLMDDDLFHIEKVEKMVGYFNENEDISLVTSYRQLIDGEGNLLPDINATRKLFSSDTIIDGKDLGNYVLMNCNNVIGEPTTVMFRRKDIEEEFGIYKGKEYYGINDLATWIHLLTKGKVVYISQALSYFRQHSGQNQKKPEVQFPAIEQWLQLIIDSRMDGYLNRDKDFEKALTCHLNLSLYIIQTFGIAGHQTFGAEEAIHKTISSLFQIKDSYMCNFCGQSFRSFLPWPDKYDFPGYEYEMWNKETAVCPSCYSIDRERLFKLYIEQHTDLLLKKNKVLHIAPELKLRKWLSSFEMEYICGDLFPQDEGIQRVDITNINYRDNHFDAVICSHVLEHVPDDRKAMEELYRVLKPGGWGILQVPIIKNISETFEDPSITTPEDRLRVFGQEDHVRLYAKSDYIDRLKSVGFSVEEYECKRLFNEDEINKYGFSTSDILYVVNKFND
ncbi:glycosyltransferase [Brevibacillus sp. HB1.2]|uniref:glycosyltransferase n=1 Tax=Brevibacillus sp. HB1.2 TaxID=2738807 RepID=UPI001575411D|nr:glycosyltransferase [Brevibacillus sp. HB1.2]NTU21783.1 glycosyltransferase [Brevibacillus sp. HB1.2]